jgi:hypothetical protein
MAARRFQEVTARQACPLDRTFEVADCLVSHRFNTQLCRIVSAAQGTALPVFNIRDTVIRNQKVPGSNLGRETGGLVRDFSWFSFLFFQASFEIFPIYYSLTDLPLGDIGI